MKNKKLILALGAFVLVIALMAGLWAANRPETTAGSKSFTVTVVHANGDEKVFTYTTDEEYLGAALLAEGLIAGEDGPYGLTLLTVDGEDAIWDVHNAYWALFIGEEYATTGVSDTPVNDGDSFTLAYTNA